MPAYFQWGAKPANPVQGTALCDICEPTMATALAINLIYDTERDARTTYNAFAQALFDRTAPFIWAGLWNNFQCTNQNCQNKDPCGAAPTWIEIGANPIQNAAGNIVWQLYVEIAREIQCVAEGGGEDCPPEWPEIPEQPQPSPPQPSPAPTGPEPQRFPDDGSGIRLYGNVTVWTGETIDISDLRLTPEKKGGSKSKYKK